MLINMTQNQSCLTPLTDIISANRITPFDYIYSVYVKLAIYLFDKFVKLCICFRELRKNRKKRDLHFNTNNKYKLNFIFELFNCCM